jgi:hypothetical protein
VEERDAPNAEGTREQLQHESSSFFAATHLIIP